MRDLALVLCWLAILPAAFTRPFLAALVAVWLTLLSPTYYVYGFGRTIPIYMISLGIGALAIVLNKQRIRLAPTPTLILFMVFLAHGGIVTLFAIGDPDLNWLLYTNLLKIFVVCFFISAVLTSRLRVHAMMIIISLGFGLHGIVEGLKVIGTAGSHHVIGIPSFGDNNQFGVGILMALPIIYYVANRASVKWVRYGFLAMSVLCFFTIIGTNSRGAFLGMVVIGILAIIRSGNAIKAGLAATAVAVILLSIAPDSWFQRMDTINNANSDGSFMGRVTIWKMSTIMALDRPFTGGGFHAIQTERVWQSYIPSYGKLSFIAAPEPEEVDARAAHSIYFEILGDTGFIGLALFLSLLALAFRNVSAVQRKLKGNLEYAWMSDLAKTLQISLIAYAFSAAALSMAYFEFYYIIITVLSVLRRMSDEVGKPEEASTASAAGRGKNARMPTRYRRNRPAPEPSAEDVPLAPGHVTPA